MAKIAVSAALYWIDKPYDYLIPEDMQEKALPGCRVRVPFSAGNRMCEGIILALGEAEGSEKLKTVISLVDDSPVITEEQLKLALFIRDRFFCTVYGAVKAMLPAGLWLNSEGGKRVGDKVIEFAALAVDPETAQQFLDAKRNAKRQCEMLELLLSFEMLPSREILRFTGASRQSLLALKKAGMVELVEKEVFRRPKINTIGDEPLPVLNEEQQAAFNGINALADEEQANAALLFGVTGSGKTSVYIHLIGRQLEKGRASILLVPEIALTPQMINTFSSHFGEEVAVLHSSLSTGERYDEWKRVKSGKARVVIGTRSAVFAPVEKLGLIIIDEEQEETYKSENNPRYNARDVAKFRCARAGALLLMGSATPDITSMYNARVGKYGYFELKSRFNEMQLPQVSVVDMRQELKKGNDGCISSYLRDEIAANIEKGEQSILFINRRGANKLVSCGECGYTYKCPKCSVSLTYHSVRKRLMCHYCGFSRKLDDSCPECGGILKFLGAGTQLVEEELKGLFPEAGVLRMDTDTVMPVGSHEKLFKKFREEKIPLMVGTQMVTKGLNFENVTLVGVVSADQSLYAGDYRAGERTFSLITQVVGRSGRGEKPGRAVIQTYTPGNETIRQAAEQDYMAFYESEIELRKLQNSPPFCDILTVTVSGTEEEQVYSVCRYIRAWLEDSEQAANMQVLGPAPLSVVRVNFKYRYRVNIYCHSTKAIRDLISTIIIECNKDKRFKGTYIYADNDPMD